MSSKTPKLVTVDYARIVAYLLQDHDVPWIAERFGVTRQTVYRWKAGHTPRPEQRDMLVDYALAFMEL